MTGYYVILFECLSNRLVSGSCSLTSVFFDKYSYNFAWALISEISEPVFIIMPNMNQIHQRLCKNWHYKNFNTKLRDLDLKVMFWDEDVPHKILDHAKHESNPSKLCKKWQCTKFNAKLLHKVSKSLTLTLRSCSGVGMVLSKILDQYLSPYMNQIHDRVWKWDPTNFNIKC